MQRPGAEGSPKAARMGQVGSLPDGSELKEPDEKVSPSVLVNANFGLVFVKPHAHKQDCIEFVKDVRSRRPAVLRRLHAVDATRVHQARSWVVSFSSLSCFGPRRGPSRRVRECAVAAMA